MANESKSKSKKTITGYVKFDIPAGKATPSPPIGPALGQKGIPSMEFCKQFNDATKNMTPNTPIRVLLTAFSDKSFTFELKGSPVSYYLKKYAKISSGSKEPGRSFVATIDDTSIEEIAKIKMLEGLSARSVEEAKKIIAGSARSMGLKVLQ